MNTIYILLVSYVYLSSFNQNYVNKLFKLDLFKYNF